ETVLVGARFRQPVARFLRTSAAEPRRVQDLGPVRRLLRRLPAQIAHGRSGVRNAFELDAPVADRAAYRDGGVERLAVAAQVRSSEAGRRSRRIRRGNGAVSMRSR